MDNEVELVSDDDGLAVLGPPRAVKRFLDCLDLWESSRTLDLRRLQPLLALGSDIATAASEAAANSGRWLKLTEESARLVEERGLTPSKKPGQTHLRHVMAGRPGKDQSWLQTEQGLGTLNPSALSALGGIMAQAAMRQSGAEIIDYLTRIDFKADEVLRKVDATVVANMAGVEYAVERASGILEETGEVSGTLWSTVDQAHQAIGATQTYALDQLDAVARRLEGPKVRGLAETASRAEREVPDWLAVLARCFQLQEAVDVIELERVLLESPDALDDYRRGLRKTQQQRRGLISDHTAHLLERMDRAVETANAKMVWNRANTLAIVESSNHLATGIQDFHDVLRIESDLRPWDVRHLGRVVDAGAQTLQVAKDKGPIVLAIGMAAAGGNKLLTKDRPG